MRNIEIKAKVQDVVALLNNAKQISGSEGTLIPQIDHFYNVSKGRLKLRKFEDGNAELMYYERPDCKGPKLSSYEKCSIDKKEVDSLDKVLNISLGSQGVVKKTRHLFIVDQTRIHVDIVENLGNFMELEVMLKPEQSVEEGEVIANGLMKRLQINEDDLLSGAYRDMIHN